MAISSTNLPSRDNSYINVYGAVFASLIILGWFLFSPFAIGYNYERISIAHQLSLLWKLEDWQHCWLVVFAIAAIVYFNRQSLAKIPIKGSSFGAIPLAIGVAFFWVGYRVDNIYIGYASIQCLLAGLIIWFLGFSWFKALLFPWGMVVFMWPLLFLDSVIAFPLRTIMSKASVVVLNFIGVPVILQGTGILSAPDILTGMKAGQRFSVDVADPCSGIRSLFALMMVSALYGYFTLNGWWKKWILFLCSIPLAIFGNLCRILMLTFGTMAMGPAVAIGTLENPSTFHMAAGYLVFAVALGGMIGISWCIQAIPQWINRQKAAQETAITSPNNLRSAKKEDKVDPY